MRASLMTTQTFQPAGTRAAMSGTSSSSRQVGTSVDVTLEARVLLSASPSSGRPYEPQSAMPAT
jgi:hypothetical protein